MDYTEFQGMFEALGAENDSVIEGTVTITDEFLSVYAAVIFCDTRSQPPLSNSEREAVVRFVRGGGSIFIIGQQDDNYVLEPSSIYASSIGSPFRHRFHYFD